MTTAAATTVSIIDYELPDYTHNLYDVVINNDVQIRTLVTQTPSFVDSWISETIYNSYANNDRIIVGLDVEWRPNFSRNFDNPVAIIQLCVHRRCLVFQLLHSPFIPQSLAEFLNNPAYTFVGVGIDSDIEKLICDYNMTVANPVDLGKLAARVRGEGELRNAGLKTLAMVILGLEVAKPKSITMSRWDNEWLIPAQVQYACLDAFLSFEIGKNLNAGGQ